MEINRMTDPDIIIYEREDGGCSYLIPGRGYSLECVREKNVPKGARKVAFINHKDLPLRTFRNAWEVNGESVDIDMPKAREIQIARIREARDNHPDWPKIDADRNRAVESGDKVLMKAVREKAQKLRDLPMVIKPNLQRAKTPHALSGIWPTILPMP